MNTMYMDVVVEEEEEEETVDGELGRRREVLAKEMIRILKA